MFYPENYYVLSLFQYFLAMENYQNDPPPPIITMSWGKLVLGIFIARKYGLKLNIVN